MDGNESFQFSHEAIFSFTVSRRLREKNIILKQSRWKRNIFDLENSQFRWKRKRGSESNDVKNLNIHKVLEEVDNGHGVKLDNCLKYQYL